MITTHEPVNRFLTSTVMVDFMDWIPFLPVKNTPRTILSRKGDKKTHTCDHRKGVFNIRRMGLRTMKNTIEIPSHQKIPFSYTIKHFPWNIYHQVNHLLNHSTQRCSPLEHHWQQGIKSWAPQWTRTRTPRPAPRRRAMRGLQRGSPEVSPRWFHIGGKMWFSWPVKSRKTGRELIIITILKSKSTILTIFNSCVKLSECIKGGFHQRG